jgi:cytochrome c biogenesis protein CcmG/thiol:disulfide interchange protein DsbE
VAGRAKLVAQALAVGLVAALLALLVWKVVQEETGGNLAEQVRRGEQPAAPLFRLERLDRKGSLSLASLRGKGVVLNFWASWCAPCKDEAPLLEQAWRDHRDRGLVVLGVDAQDFRGDARKFVERYGLSYPMVYDGKGSTLGRYGVGAFPETYIVDRRGRVVAAIIGGIGSDDDRERLEQGIELALRSS